MTPPLSHLERPDGRIVAGPARSALLRAADTLRAQQRHGRHWAGTLSSSATATAMCIVGLHIADRARHADRIRRGRRWLLETQRADGGWPDAVIDPSNINATSIAVGALTLTAEGDEPAETRAAMARAIAALGDFGGWSAVGDPRRCALSGPSRTVAALAGLMDRRTIKRLRPEVILLPPRLRRAISTSFPAYLSISTLHSTFAPHPLNTLPTYRRARTAAAAWLGRALGPDGSFEESAFLAAVAVTGMIAAGQGDLPWLREAVDFVVRSQRDDGSWPVDRDLETFDTDMSVFAFHEAGLPIPNADSVREWLLARQSVDPCFATGARPGGWAWAMPDGWPECDDTAYTILALRTLGMPASVTAIRRGARWLERMQNRDGSWSTFVRNSRLPFDHDCPYITGHVLSALRAANRLGPGSRILARARAYLTRVQRYDGSFPSIWFREATAGTASILEALADCDLAHTPMAIRARDWLLRHRNDDGGWGGVRLDASTAEETGWALLALLRVAPSVEVAHAVRRGVDWLVERQRPDGTWDAAPIGLYYSALSYSDTSYALTLPMRALARAGARDAAD